MKSCPSLSSTPAGVVGGIRAHVGEAGGLRVDVGADGGGEVDGDVSTEAPKLSI